MSSHFLTSAPARLRLLLAASTLVLLSACQSAPTQPAASPAAATSEAPAPEANTEPPILGKHADSHGCKPSTGHAWCERTQSCERPWELALKRGFENTPAGWHAYCDGSTR